MKKVTLNKIASLETKSLSNALRLHFDSILLYNNKRFPSAFFLSVISLEELGKVLFLDDFIWHEAVDNPHYVDPNSYNFFQYIYDHKFKQLTFASDSDLGNAIYKSVMNRIFENRKQNSLYVGLPKLKGKPNLHGRILGPFRFSEKTVTKQITLVNDYLKQITLGELKEYFRIETTQATTLLTMDLLQYFDAFLATLPDSS